MILEGKKILVTGIANHRSIAWGIAQACMDAGAEIAVTYQNERLRASVEKTLGDRKPELLLECDVSDDESVASMFAKLGQQWGRVDGIVHSIAFADRADLKGGFNETSRSGFALAQDVSAYSLVVLARYAKPLMQEHGGSIICMSYLGGERVFTNYNVMGVAKASLEMSAKYLAADLGPNQIRVNIVSPGPIRTLAAAGVSGFAGILDFVAERAPLRRNIDQAEVGKVAAFLLSDWASGVTGETIHVDAGFHMMGM